ncbi:hypothetical protein [Mucilaginibacter dorajii]|uniref:Uncharacterized protein n=1 Tax=Mucilaginibacter dorajii TaxID=692994 RepID=A0ABP7QZP7_9SPHI|nr:hypothetical protein [Mucilaginibacter dorajii]MCS3732333.1 hypothetical protein [Mucilaginibacter dorajii]
MIEEYIVQTDYWLTFFEKINQEVGKNKHDTSKELIIDVLQKQWEYLLSETEMQHLILWELSGDSELMKSIHHTREMLADIS